MCCVTRGGPLQVFSALMQQETTFFDDPKVILAKPDAPAPSLRPKDSGQVLGATTILDNDIRTLQSTITDKLPASVGHIIRCALMLQQKPSFVFVPVVSLTHLQRPCLFWIHFRYLLETHHRHDCPHTCRRLRPSRFVPSARIHPYCYHHYYVLNALAASGPSVAVVQGQ